MHSAGEFCFQAARGHLDQQVVVTVDVGGEAELPHENHGAACVIVEQHRCAIAAVVGLACLGLPTAVAAAERECGLAQDRPVICQNLHILDTHASRDTHFVTFVLSVAEEPCNIMQCQLISCR